MELLHFGGRSSEGIRNTFPNNHLFNFQDYIWKLNVTFYIKKVTPK